MLNQLSSKTAGYTVSAIIAIVANTLLTVAKESYPPLLATMKTALGHHWTTHGVAIIALFFVLGYVFSKWPSIRRISGTLLAALLALAIILSSSGLFLFFLAE